MAIDFKKLGEVKERLSKSGGNNQFWKPEDGKNVIRILPDVNQGDNFFMEIWAHYRVGEDSKMVVCGRTEDKKCPICAELEKLKKGTKHDKELAESMRSKRNYYLQIVTEDEPDVPKIYSAPKSVFSAIIDIILNPDYGDITDVEEGRYITIEKSGKGLKTSYSVLPKPKASEIEDWEELKEKMVDLGNWDFAKVKSDAEMMKIYNSEEAEEEEEDFEDEEKGYDDMSLSELKKLCAQRGIDLPAKPTPIKLITLLEEYDEENSDEDEDDEVMDDIAETVKKKKR